MSFQNCVWDEVCRYLRTTAVNPDETRVSVLNVVRSTSQARESDSQPASIQTGDGPSG